jgi:hypothetical protein
MNQELKKYIIDQGIKEDDIANMQTQTILEWKKLQIEEKKLSQGI